MGGNDLEGEIEWLGHKIPLGRDCNINPVQAASLSWVLWGLDLDQGWVQRCVEADWPHRRRHSWHFNIGFINHQPLMAQNTKNKMPSCFSSCSWSLAPSVPALNLFSKVILGFLWVSPLVGMVTLSSYHPPRVLCEKEPFSGSVVNQLCPYRDQWENAARPSRSGKK